MGGGGGGGCLFLAESGRGAGTAPPVDVAYACRRARARTHSRRKALINNVFILLPNVARVELAARRYLSSVGESGIANANRAFFMRCDIAEEQNASVRLFVEYSTTFPTISSL